MLVVASLLLLGTAFTTLFVALSHAASALGGAQQVATPHEAIKTILDTGAVSDGTRFVELGYGAGTVLASAAERGATVGGIDISPLAYLLARWRLRGFRSAGIAVGNMFSYDLHATDIVYCYLLPPLLKRLEPKFQTELKPGSRVVSYAFPLPTKQPAKIIPRTNGLGRIFLYTY